jgi:DeoR/GlpR family transcriptional regulator of sugar metabolism
VTVSELVEELNISTETVRRDLLFLEKQNRLQRVHGGAVALTDMKKFADLSQRLQENTEQKKQLSQIAALLVKEGDIIAIDAGSTAIEFVRILKNQFTNLTVITHSLQNFEELKSAPGFKTILVGGEYLPKEDLFYGSLSLEMIQKLHVSTCFLFPFAISLKYGVADYIPETIAIQKAYIEIANKTVILADSSKFEKTAFIKLCEVNSSYTFITSSDLDDSIFQMYQNKGLVLYKDKKELIHE